jgi:hypothetical protein
VLQKHYDPKPLVIAERCTFYKHIQASGEAIVAELRQLVITCDFGTFLDDALGDCGLRNEIIQKRLLTESDLTFAKAIDIALCLTSAERNAKSMKADDQCPLYRLDHKGSQSDHKGQRPSGNSVVFLATDVGMAIIIQISAIFMRLLPQERSSD